MIGTLVNVVALVVILAVAVCVQMARDEFLQLQERLERLERKLRETRTHLKEVA